MWQKRARNGHTKIIYKGTFISDRSLNISIQLQLAPIWKYKYIFHNQFISRNCTWHVMLELDWDIFIKPLIKRSQHNRHKTISSNAWIFCIYWQRCPVFPSKWYLANFQIYWSAIIKNPIHRSQFIWSPNIIVKVIMNIP